MARGVNYVPTKLGTQDCTTGTSYWAGLGMSCCARSVWNGGCVPGQELAGIQNLVLPFPLDVRYGVPLCLALEHGRVALVHRRGLWL